MFKLGKVTLTGITLLMLIFAMAACQKNGQSVPVLPGTDSDSLTAGSVVNDESRSANNHALWGIWDCSINPDTCEVELVPIRGLEWHANVVEFMQHPHPPTSLGMKVDIANSDPPNGFFQVEITLTHPFPGLDMYQGFDVRGTFLADGSYESAWDDDAQFADPDPLVNEAKLLNADGYHRWFNPSEFPESWPDLFSYIPTMLGTADDTTATLNPFKYFSDDFLSSSTHDLTLQEVDLEPARRGVFSTSSSVMRVYKIQFPVVSGAPLFRFSYVVDASYHEPDDADPHYPLEAFAPSANVQELFKIRPTDNNSTAYYEDSASYGGNLNFNLELFDWQSPYNPSGVPGEIGNVYVESPTLLGNYADGKLDITDDFKLNALEASEVSSVAQVEIADVTPTGLDNQYLFFTITSADPSDYGNPWGAPYPEQPVLAAYYLWQVPIAPEPLNAPPYVGNVVGPELVDISDPDQNYYPDSVYDPDLGQTLTSMWSVVPEGNSPVFDIPSNPDHSVDIDWSTYTANQNYDVNIEVNDGYVSVQGTLLTVSVTGNNVPQVGSVTGTTPVTVANTSEAYSATINDPDAPPQVLTVLWSVVPNGDSPSYTIPAETDYSLDQDWSTYDVGDYDVNLQVDDGVAPPVEGTLLTVTLNNTAPTLGAITGPTPVDETDSASQYNHGTMTDPDNNQTHTYTWSFVPNGDSADFSVAPNGANDSLIIDWCSYPPGMYDLQCRVNDGTSNGDSAVFTVTRGLSSCTGTAHVYSSTGHEWSRFSVNYTPPGWPTVDPPPTPVLDSCMLPRMDMDFFTRGDFAGQGVMQAGPNALVNFTADNTGFSDPSTVYSWRIPGMGFYDSDWLDAIPCSPRVVTSLDCSPDLDSTDGYTDNRIVIVTSHHHDNIYVIDADEALEANQLMTTLTDVNGAKEIPCIALDEDNDIWAMVQNSSNQFHLHHWTHNVDDGTGGPYYTYVSGDTLNLTTQLGSQTDVYDMVVAFTNNHLYILEGGGGTNRGKIHEVDLGTSPPSYEGSQGDIFYTSLESGNTWSYLDWGTDTSTHQYVYGADITIDHIGFDSCEPEHCRLEVMGKLTSNTSELVRLDLNLNTLNTQQSTDSYTFYCYGISSDSNEGDRVLVCPPWMLYGENSDPANQFTNYYFYYWLAPMSW